MFDYYAVLEIDKNATTEDIKAAYRKLAFLHHPDRNPGDKAADSKFKQVQEAYETLSDPDKKKKFDGIKTTRPSGFKPFNNIWDNFFGEGNPPTDRGRNLQLNLEIELVDVLYGTTKKISIPNRVRCIKCEALGYTAFSACSVCHGSGKTAFKQSPFNVYIGCGNCKGTGRAGTISCDACRDGFVDGGHIEADVTISPGIETGHHVRVIAKGEPSKHPHGINGDLIIVVLVKEHKFLTRQGANLHLEFPIGYSELYSGTSLEIPTLTGSAILTVPPFTQDLSNFRLRGLGLPYSHGSGKGDLIVCVKLAMPNKSDADLFTKIGEFEKDFLIEQRKRYKNG